MADIEKELREGIAYFEQILNVLPGDRTALEFLGVAYRQLGDEAKYISYSIALAEVILREKDAEGAADLIEKLKDCADPRAKAAVLKLQVLGVPPPELTYEKTMRQESCANPAIAAKAEIALLKRLVDEGVLHASLVRTAFDQLENLPSGEGDFLISALQILEKENLTGAADAVVAVADAAHAPPVPLESFDVPAAYVHKLPEKLVKVRGVVPFARLGSEWAVAVLNPLDDELRIEVTELLGARCHFFLAPPPTIDKVLERLYRVEEGEGDQPAGEPVAAVPPPREGSIIG